jgi:hypothetical protein
MPSVPRSTSAGRPQALMDDKSDPPTGTHPSTPVVATSEDEISLMSRLACRARPVTPSSECSQGTS